jgi:hypothetical protein
MSGFGLPNYPLASCFGGANKNGKAWGDGLTEKTV